MNSASGVRTPMGGAYTGALVIVCLALLMPYCAFIPKVKHFTTVLHHSALNRTAPHLTPLLQATLSAVIITAVVNSVEYEVVAPIWRSKSKEMAIAKYS